MSAQAIGNHSNIKHFSEETINLDDLGYRLKNIVKSPETLPAASTENPSPLFSTNSFFSRFSYLKSAKAMKFAFGALGLFSGLTGLALLNRPSSTPNQSSLIPCTPHSVDNFNFDSYSALADCSSFTVVDLTQKSWLIKSNEIPIPAQPTIPLITDPLPQDPAHADQLAEQRNSHTNPNHTTNPLPFLNEPNGGNITTSRKMSRSFQLREMPQNFGQESPDEKSFVESRRSQLRAMSLIGSFSEYMGPGLGLLAGTGFGTVAHSDREFCQDLKKGPEGVINFIQQKVITGVGAFLTPLVFGSLAYLINRRSLTGVSRDQRVLDTAKGISLWGIAFAGNAIVTKVAKLGAPILNSVGLVGMSGKPWNPSGHIWMALALTHSIETHLIAIDEAGFKTMAKIVKYALGTGAMIFSANTAACFHTNSEIFAGGLCGLIAISCVDAVSRRAINMIRNR